MKEYRVAILGATGAVGQEMIRVLQERKFPVGELVPLASARSAGKCIDFQGQQVTIQEAREEAFHGIDIVLGAAEADISRKFAPSIVASGAVYVDNSSAFRLDPHVPLVVPEVNGEDIALHQGIIANPNCCTTIALTAIHGLREIASIRALSATTYQAVSGAGAAGPVELEVQLNAALHGEEYPPKVFRYPIAFNLIPQIGDVEYGGYTSEEMKMQNEGRRILHDPLLRVSCTCVRVPVVRSHSIAVTVRFDRKVSVEEAREALSHAQGVKLMDDTDAGIYPMPLDTSNQDLVYVGRIRQDLTDDHAICLWCCGDQVRKGAATNCIQIAERVIALP